MTSTPYPDAFYVAHKLFTGSAFPVPVWGDLLDGPLEQFADVVSEVWDCFDANDAPTRDNLRVWYIEPGKPAQDVTDAVIAAHDDRIEALYE